ncbi:MAG: hypothetical protein IJ593_11525 [Lachnospiraceae bacterium]|nr:hypothetical protein [Lachnospiraceae bacterium]
MREILFRGYSKKKVWVYGNLLENDRPQEGSIYQIANKTTDSRFDVEEDSIGQYTGFEDKNGKKIFEGDVLHWDIDYYGYAEMINGRWIILPKAISSEDYYIDELANKVEIIGNVYEERLRKEK